MLPNKNNEYWHQRVVEFCLENRRGAALKKWPVLSVEEACWTAIINDTIEIVCNDIGQIDCVVLGQQRDNEIHIIAAIARPGRQHTLKQAAQRHLLKRNAPLTALRKDKKVQINERYLNKVLALA